MRPNQRSPLRSFDYLGLYRYFLTFCTDRRHPHFTDAVNVSMALSQISRAAREYQFAILAYCFMPDHLHLLVEGLADGSDCRAFIKAAKQYSGFYFVKRGGDKLWQRYGYDRVLRDEEATVDVARYIVQNPVRAKLVDDPRAYPFVGSAIYTIDEIL